MRWQHCTGRNYATADGLGGRCTGRGSRIGIVNWESASCSKHLCIYVLSLYSRAERSRAAQRRAEHHLTVVVFVVVD